MYRRREFRMVETERLTVSEWTSEGSLERLFKYGLTGTHPLSIGTRMMVRVSERTFFNVNLGGIAEVYASVPLSGQKRF